jgi:hypothetical protein
MPGDIMTVSCELLCRMVSCGRGSHRMDWATLTQAKALGWPIRDNPMPFIFEALVMLGGGKDDHGKSVRGWSTHNVTPQQDMPAMSKPLRRRCALAIEDALFESLGSDAPVFPIKLDLIDWNYWHDFKLK